MRRLLSILLLAAFALPIVAPALALGQDPDAGLPACCRRHGQHHCTMLDRDKDPSVHRFVAACPYYPRHEAPPVTGMHLLALHSPQQAAIFSAALAPAVRAETHRRISRERSRYKRGPPSRLFL